MKLKKSTIVLIVLAVIFLGLSVVSTKYSVTRTIHAIDEIGDMKLNDDSIDRFKKAAEYYIKQTALKMYLIKTGNVS